MKLKTLAEVLAEDNGSVDAVLAEIERLRAQLKEGRVDDWENLTLEQYLRAMHSWLETVGPRVGESPSWKFVEIMLGAAKIYE